MQANSLEISTPERPRVQASHRRAARPVKLLLAALLVTATLLYGGAKSRGFLGSAATAAGAAGQLGAQTEQGPGVEQGPSDATAALNVAGLPYMFLALAVVCDEFFVPALDVITKKLDLSPDVAGATFMAAGGSAPEFFTAMVGVFQSSGPSDVGIAAIVGSAVFNVLFVIGACGIAAKATLTLTPYPLARDSAFYVVHLLLLCYWFLDGLVEWWEALIQFVMYIIYCIFMAYSQKIEDKIVAHNSVEGTTTKMKDKEVWHGHLQRLDTNGDGVISKAEVEASTDAGAKALAEQWDEFDADGDGIITKQEFKKALRSRRQKRQLAAVASGEAPEPDEPVSLMPPQQCSCMNMIYWIFSLPIILVLMFTVPDVRRKSPSQDPESREPGCWQKWYPVTFALAIAWIALFSTIMVGCSEVVGEWTGIDYRILALTLIASGTSVPDLLTSVIVTLQGHGDMAISSSIGSNIFDVTVGLPVPWLLYSAVNGGAPVPVQSEPITMAVQIGSLIGMLVAVVVSIKCNGWVLNKPLGIAMLILYVGFMYLSIQQVLQEDA